jgi:hypothetical protein
VALPDLNSAFSLSNLGRQQLIRRAIDESFVSGFRWIMALGAALAATSAVTALFSIGATRVRASHES